MISISKHVYFYKLNEIGNKYSIAYHSIIKMKPQEHILTLIRKIMKNILKLGTMLEYQNIKTFLQKFTFQIGLKMFSWLKTLKTLWRGHMLWMILTVKKLLHRFTKKNWKRQIKNILECLREKVINYMLNGKAIIILLTVGLIKKTYYKWLNTFLNRDVWGGCVSWIRFLELCNKGRFKKRKRCWYMEIYWKCWFS